MASRLSPTDAEIEALPAEEVIRWAYEEWGDRVCLTCSWQKQSSVLVHMLAELGLPIDVVELDTHLFFRESYETRERLVERYGLTLIRPEIMTIAEQHAREGANLWESQPDRCCHIRKVEPLIQTLEPYDAWISGIRRDQSPSRAELRTVERSEVRRQSYWMNSSMSRFSTRSPSRPADAATVRSSPLRCVPASIPRSFPTSGPIGRSKGNGIACRFTA